MVIVSCFNMILHFKTFTGLQATLLVRHPDTGKLYVNFDPLIVELIRETDCMMKMGLEIPISARILFQRRDHLKSTEDKLKVSK